MRRFALVVVVAVVGCDHGSKELARRGLRERAVTLIHGVLELRYAENPGVAFRLDRVVPEPVRRPLVVLVPLAITAAVALAFVRRRPRGFEAVALALVLGGAVGNLLDRVIRGHVVDFIHVRHWPIFNVADVALVGGMVLLLITSRRPMEPASSSPT